MNLTPSSDSHEGQQPVNDLPALAGRIMSNLRKLSHALNDPARTEHDEWESAIHVRRIVATWALEARGFKTP